MRYDFDDGKLDISCPGDSTPPIGEISKQQAWWGSLDPGSQLIAYSILRQSIAILLKAEKKY